ncbi:MAG: hypothetical protein U5K79_07015 [Cyclobacteriaceae bacterium]|nr:hypothetical protein [Cyclobacteriaceae bacterium]
MDEALKAKRAGDPQVGGTREGDPHEDAGALEIAGLSDDQTKSIPAGP